MPKLGCEELLPNHRKRGRAAVFEKPAGGDDVHPVIRQLQWQPPPDDAEIDAILNRHQMPLIEPGAATFIYRGDADAVYLRRFIHGKGAGVPLQQIADTGVWHCRIRVARGARFEYKFDVVRNGSTEWINDPLNPHFASDPFGSNSVCQAWGYRAPSWVSADKRVQAGSLVDASLHSASFGEERSIRVYLPSGFAEDQLYPLAVLHDGNDFVDHAGLATVLNNLIHRKAIPPVIVALTQSPAREIEYTGDPRQAAFLSEELLPFLQGRYPLCDERSARMLGGASLGAVSTLNTAWRYPGLFGGLVLQSGSFVLDRALLQGRAGLFEQVADLVDEMLAEPRDIASSVFVSSGLNEGLLTQNRRLAKLLGAQGIKTRFIETPDGHHWQNWRDQMREALVWTLPTPARSR